MSGFTKLFNSILHSTIWSEPDHVRIIWITMLAMSDKHGEVHAAVPGLARMAGKSVEETEDALRRFQEPDRHSRTPDFEGRRIEKISGGWRLLNHGKYRALLSADERREYFRKKKAEYRAKKKTDGDTTDPGLSENVLDIPQCPHIAEAEAEAEPPKPPKGGELSGVLLRLWSEAPQNARSRSSKEKLRKSWARTSPKPSEAVLMDALSLWASSFEWTKEDGEFIPGIHRWVTEKKWENPPVSAKPAKAPKYWF
jgi:hypothetical protein